MLHDLAAVLGGGEDRLHRREAEQVDEGLEVLGVGALRRPGEAVVAADQDPDAAPVHLLAGLDGVLEFALIGDRDRRARLDAPFAGVAGGVDQPGEAGGDEVLVLVRLQHVERLFVGERGVIDVLDAVPHALNDRAGGARVRGEHLAARLGLATPPSRLLPPTSAFPRPSCR